VLFLSRVYAAVSDARLGSIYFTQEIVNERPEGKPIITRLPRGVTMRDYEYCVRYTGEPACLTWHPCLPG
jgi:hypothetical protein